ncbi:MAG: anti-phage BREX system Lon protease BrxL [Adlercreutzia equolifaciens]
MSDSSTTINEAMDEVSAAAAVDDVFETDAVDRLAVEHFPADRAEGSDGPHEARRQRYLPSCWSTCWACTAPPTTLAVEAGLGASRHPPEQLLCAPTSQRSSSKIRELGSYTVIDKVSARLDEHSDVRALHRHRASPFIMPAEYVRQCEDPQGGIWCILRIQYTHRLTRLRRSFQAGAGAQAVKKKRRRIRPSASSA